MKNIEIISGGQKLQFTTKSAIIDGKEYFYIHMSDVYHNATERCYTFTYGNEVKKIPYELKDAKILSSIFKQVGNLVQAKPNVTAPTGTTETVRAAETAKAAQVAEAARTAEAAEATQVAEAARAAEAAKAAQIAEATRAAEAAKAAQIAEAAKAAQAAKAAKIAEATKTAELAEAEAAKAAQIAEAARIAAIAAAQADTPESNFSQPEQNIAQETSLEKTGSELPQADEAKLKSKNKTKAEKQAEKAKLKAEKQAKKANLKSAKKAGNTDPDKDDTSDKDTTTGLKQANTIEKKVDPKKKAKTKKALAIFAMILIVLLIASIVYFLVFGTTSNPDPGTDTKASQQYDNIDDLINDLQ